MSTVDEILESGRYTDRRGRSWRPNLGDNWVHFRGRKPRGELFYDVLTASEMRLLIERDQHRDECEGLRECGYHPVPFVEVFRHLRPPYHVDYQVVDTSIEPNFNQGLYRTLPAAMDAARALAVGE